jgi:hypothetical protein
MLTVPSRALREQGPRRLYAGVHPKHLTLATAFYPLQAALSRLHRGRRSGVSWPVGQLNITDGYAKRGQPPAKLAWWPRRYAPFGFA